MTVENHDLLGPPVVPGRLRATLACVSCEVDVRVEVPGEIGYRRFVLRTVAAMCELASRRVSGENSPAGVFGDQVVSAVGEAFNNIALHCYRDRPRDIVRLGMRIDDDRLVLILEDFGISFDPLSAPPPDPASLPTSGLGVFIMRSLMDQVNYRPGRPNQLTLSKRIVTRSAGITDRRVGGRTMDLSTRFHDGVATLRIAGTLDAVTIPDVRPAIDALIAERHTRIVVDLSDLRLIDSSGIGALVFLYKKAKEYGGVVTVEGVHEQPLSIFKLLRLDRVLFA